METVMFCLTVFFSIVAWFISLNVYFAHDDIKAGRGNRISVSYDVNLDYLYK
jgi:hypothetical protein